jgi:hypothetical protein
LDVGAWLAARSEEKHERKDEFDYSSGEWSDLDDVVFGVRPTVDPVLIPVSAFDAEDSDFDLMFSRSAPVRPLVGGWRR